MQKDPDTTVDGSEIRQTTWDVSNLVNNGRNYQAQRVIAGFLQSTVPWAKYRPTRDFCPLTCKWSEVSISACSTGSLQHVQRCLVWNLGRSAVKFQHSWIIGDIIKCHPFCCWGSDKIDKQKIYGNFQGFHSFLLIFNILASYLKASYLKTNNFFYQMEMVKLHHLW